MQGFATQVNLYACALLLAAVAVYNLGDYLGDYLGDHLGSLGDDLGDHLHLGADLLGEVVRPPVGTEPGVQGAGYRREGRQLSRHGISSGLVGSDEHAAVLAAVEAATWQVCDAYGPGAYAMR